VPATSARGDDFHLPPGFRTVWQRGLGLLKGTIRATVLIETIMSAFEMDEILYELRDHSAGLNCGRWDYTPPGAIRDLTGLADPGYYADYLCQTKS
jgi:hypothetical protein